MSARYCARICSGSDKTGLCVSTEVCEFFIPDVTMEKSYAPPQPTVPTESEEQEALFAWCLSNGIDMVHIPNERKCTAYVAGQLLRQGLRKGFPDNFIPIARGGFHGLFIELKRAKKSLSKKSPEQREWVKKLNAAGYKAVFCYGAEEAKKVISEYLSPCESNATFGVTAGNVPVCVKTFSVGRFIDRKQNSAYSENKRIKTGGKKMVVESVLDAYRKDVAREILGKVYKAVEEVRLDCEFQDEKGNWLMDSGQFFRDFTIGKLFEIAGEYGIDLLENNSAEGMKDD